MKSSKIAYQTWAPAGADWTEWVKPAAFIFPPVKKEYQLNIIRSEWLRIADKRIMIIVDLPGDQSVREGLGLAQVGFRPIPLYNGTSGGSQMKEIVKTSDVIAALFAGADVIEDLHLEPDAPPAFLLDSYRMETRTYGGNDQYDNRWSVFPQDMPSAEYLRKKGIERVVVRSKGIRTDLAHILYRYSQQGIHIYLVDSSFQFKEQKVRKPTSLYGTWYRFMTILGLKRHAAGGFGGAVPDVYQGSHRSYRGG